MKINTLWDNFFLERKSDSIIDFLKSITLFEDLKTDELIRLERTLYKRHYKKNEIIFNEGDPGAALYILKEGTVDVVMNYNNNPILLTKLSDGMFFGEIALFDETPRSATVVASEECEIIALPKADFMLFSQKKPSTGLKIVMRLGEILATRLMHTNKQIKNLKSEHA